MHQTLQKLIHDQKWILTRLDEIYGYCNPKEFHEETLKLLAHFE